MSGSGSQGSAGMADASEEKKKGVSSNATTIVVQKLLARAECCLSFGVESSSAGGKRSGVDNVRAHTQKKKPSGELSWTSNNNNDLDLKRDAFQCFERVATTVLRKTYRSC